MDKITENFTLKEFFKSDTAIRNNIDNTTTDRDIIYNITRLTIEDLQPVRNEFGGIRITSGYRCRELNNFLNGSFSSYHTFGMAADIKPYNKNIKLIDIIDFIYYNCDFTEMIAEWLPNGWIHVAYDENKIKRNLKIKNDHLSYKKVTIQELHSLVD